MIVAAVDPEAARREAAEILDEQRFSDRPTPRPLRGVVEWIGDRTESVLRWIDSVLSSVPWPAWVALVLVALGWLAWRVRRAATRPRVRPQMTPAARATPEPEDPDELERRAAAAESAGDYERAVRLRFRAGLVRLGRQHTIEYRSSITTADVRTRVASTEFDDLADQFERVTYGAQDAAASDARRAREQWPAVLTATRRRAPR